MIYVIFSTLIYTLFSVYINNKAISNSKRKHIRHWIEDIIQLFVIATIIGINFGFGFQSLLLLCISFTLYWTLFDFLLNVVRKKDKPWCYVSEGNLIDRLLSIIPCWGRIPFKITVLTGLIILHYEKF